MAVVTLGGLSGGGSRLLGPQMANLLDYEYVDRLLLKKVAENLGTSVDVIETHELRPKTFTEKLQELIVHALEQSAISPIGNEPYLGSSMAPLLTDDYEHILSGSKHIDNASSKKAYFVAISSAIYELAENGDVVINGRGACKHCAGEMETSPENRKSFHCTPEFPLGHFAAPDANFKDFAESLHCTGFHCTGGG